MVVGCGTGFGVPVPQIRYVENDGVSIAYARWGEGREPVVYVPPWVSNIELMWELPQVRPHL